MYLQDRSKVEAHPKVSLMKIIREITSMLSK
ncbi:hypothetical protein [Candidatus Hakubella thermalkaliphila]